MFIGIVVISIINNHYENKQPQNDASEMIDQKELDLIKANF